MECLICHRQFQPKRKDASFCSPKCRKQKERSVTDNVTDIYTFPSGQEFIPNYKELGLTKEQVKPYILQFLKNNRKKILSKGLEDDSFQVTFGDKMFTL